MATSSLAQPGKLSQVPVRPDDVLASTVLVGPALGSCTCGDLDYCPECADLHAEATAVRLGLTGIPVPPWQKLADYVREEADWYRLLGSPRALLIAEALDRLVSDLKATGAEKPEDHFGRLGALEEWRESDLWEKAERQGFERGRKAAGGGR